MIDFPSKDISRWFDSLERVVDVISTYDVRMQDDYLIVDTTSSTVDIFLPFAINGRKLVISNHTGANNVTLVPSGADTVNVSVLTPGQTVSLKAIIGGWLVY